MPDHYVLDTSAILTLTDREDGYEEIEQLLKNSHSKKCRIQICAISLMELYYITLSEQGEEKASRLIALIKTWPVECVYPDEKILLQAGKLKAHYRLSLADALIAAVAKLNNAILLHKDPELESLENEISLYSLPYKKKSS